MAGTSVRKRPRRQALPEFKPPSRTRSRNMAAIKGTNTKPELLVRSAVHRAGFRFRIHPSGMVGRPDFVLPRHRMVVFVHGCFWHGHQCKIGHVPRSNVEYWTAKIRRNAHRDGKNLRILRQQGWVVTTLRECTLRDDTRRLVRSLARRRARTDC